MSKVQFALMILMSAIATAEPFARAGKFGKNSQKIAVALSALRAAIQEVLAEPPAPAPMKSARPGRAKAVRPKAEAEFAGFKLKM